MRRARHGAWLGAAAMAALLASAQPARAGLDDFEEELIEAITDGFFEAWDEWLESLRDWLFLPQPGIPEPGGELGEVGDVIGSGDNSYLGEGGADLGVLYPGEGPRSADEGQEYVEQRAEDRLIRVEEAMAVASAAATGLPAMAARLDTLAALNRSPVSVLGAAQLGTEASLETARAVGQLAGIVAEQAQLQADAAAREEWAAREGQRTSMGRIGPLWQGERRFSPDTIPLDF